MAAGASGRLDQPFEVTNRQLLGDGTVGQLLLDEHVVNAGQQLGVPEGQLAGRHVAPGGLAQVEQAEVVGDRAAVLAEAEGEFLLGVAQPVGQGAVGEGPFDRVQVRPVDVLDQGQLGLLGGVDPPEQGGQAGEAGQLGRPPAALAGDEFVAARGLADDDRLDEARALEAVGQRCRAASSKVRRGWCGLAVTWKVPRGTIRRRRRERPPVPPCARGRQVGDRVERLGHVQQAAQAAAQSGFVLRHVRSVAAGVGRQDCAVGTRPVEGQAAWCYPVGGRILRPERRIAGPIIGLPCPTP